MDGDSLSQLVLHLNVRTWVSQEVVEQLSLTHSVPNPPQRQPELKDDLSDIVKQVCEK